MNSACMKHVAPLELAYGQDDEVINIALLTELLSASHQFNDEIRMTCPRVGTARQVSH
jgi:hypothetical protein